MYLYRAIDDRGHTIEFLLSSTRDRPAAMRFLRQTLARRGRPHRIGFDRSQTNRQAIRACNAESRLQDRSGAPQPTIKIRSSQYLNNRIEPDHRGYQTACSTHARIQVDLNRSGYHLGHRTDPYDAQKPGALCQCYKSVIGGPVRPTRSVIRHNGKPTAPIRQICDRTSSPPVTPPSFSAILLR